MLHENWPAGSTQIRAFSLPVWGSFLMDPMSHAAFDRDEVLGCLLCIARGVARVFCAECKLARIYIDLGDLPGWLVVGAFHLFLSQPARDTVSLYSVLAVYIRKNEYFMYVHMLHQPT